MEQPDSTAGIAPAESPATSASSPLVDRWMPVAVVCVAALGSGIGALAIASSGSATVAAGLSVVIAAAASAWMNHRVGRNRELVSQLAAATREVGSTGGLQRLEPSKLGHLAPIAESLNGILDSVGGVAHHVLGVVNNVQDLPARLHETMSEVADSAESQEETVEETASLLANINNSIRDIDDRVDKLARSAEESASSILQMGSSVEEVARNAGALHTSAEASTSAVHQMGASIRQVADSAENVQRMAEETASSTTEMDRSVQQVGEYVKEASEFTARVSEGALQGYEAVGDTIRDIEGIRDLTHDSTAVLERLVSRIREIAEILNVIGEINDETNLLSLNAAIIAAQAGEQGKAFLVVANHVKVLAQRTASSTEEIERLISAVKNESNEAVQAMSTGSQAIEKGVARSKLAGDALQSIRELADESNTRVTEIARASEEQMRNSQLVARAAQESSTQVQQITAALAEQSRAGDQLLKSSESALELCSHVHRSTEEQRETGRYITEAMSNITEMIRAIKENTSDHAVASESVSSAVMRLLDNAQKGANQIPAMQRMLGELSGNANTIVDALSSFESGRNGFED